MELGSRGATLQSLAVLFRMPPVSSLSQIVSYADEHLRLREIADWPNALNGLQLENSGDCRQDRGCSGRLAARDRWGHRARN